MVNKYLCSTFSYKNMFLSWLLISYVHIIYIIKKFNNYNNWRYRVYVFQYCFEASLRLAAVRLGDNLLSFYFTALKSQMFLSSIKVGYKTTRKYSFKIWILCWIHKFSARPTKSILTYCSQRKDQYNTQASRSPATRTILNWCVFTSLGSPFLATEEVLFHVIFV